MKLYEFIKDEKKVEFINFLLVGKNTRWLNYPDWYPGECDHDSSKMDVCSKCIHRYREGDNSIWCSHQLGLSDFLNNEVWEGCFLDYTNEKYLAEINKNNIEFIQDVLNTEVE